MDHSFICEEYYKEHLTNISGVKFTLRRVDMLSCMIQKLSQNSIMELLDIGIHAVKDCKKEVRTLTQSSHIDEVIQFVDESDKKKYLNGVLCGKGQIFSQAAIGIDL